MLYKVVNKHHVYSLLEYTTPVYISLHTYCYINLVGNHVEKINTRAQGNQHNRPYKPYIYEEEVTEIIPVMTEVEQISRKDHIIETEEAILLLEVGLVVLTTNKGYTINKTVIEMEVLIDNRGLEVFSDPHLGDLSSIKIDASFADS